MKLLYGLVILSCIRAASAYADGVKVLLPNQKIDVKDLGAEVKSVSCSLPFLCKCERKTNATDDDRVVLNKYDPETDRKIREVVILHERDYPTNPKAFDVCVKLIQQLKDCNSLYEKPR